jgi:hypothetical protein
MKARFPFVAVFTAFLFLAAPIANSEEANGKNSNLTTACGSKEKNTCRGKCYYEYEQFICGNPKPGQVGKHKKELKECYQSCKASK